MFKPQPYEPRIARRWLIVCGALGLLMSIVTVLVATDTVTPWLLYPSLVWFVIGVLGALLYGLGGMLSQIPGSAPPEDVRLYGVQRFHETTLISDMSDKTLPETIELVNTFWGTVPETLEQGGPLGEEWKFALGEGDWLIVCRVR